METAQFAYAVFDNNPDHFVICVNEIAQAPCSFLQVNSSSSSYLVTGLSPAVNYTFAVTAYAQCSLTPGSAQESIGYRTQAINTEDVDSSSAVISFFTTSVDFGTCEAVLTVTYMGFEYTPSALPLDDGIYDVCISYQDDASCDAVNITNSPSQSYISPTVLQNVVGTQLYYSIIGKSGCSTS